MANGENIELLQSDEPFHGSKSTNSDLVLMLIVKSTIIIVQSIIMIYKDSTHQSKNEVIPKTQISFISQYVYGDVENSSPPLYQFHNNLMR